MDPEPVMAVLLPGIHASQLVLVCLGLATGVISGFVGVGGGIIVTPALVILGMPAHYAVGTGMVWVMGNAVAGTLRHRYEGNGDFKLAVVMAVFTVAGTELGVLLINFGQQRGMADKAVLSLSCVVLVLVGGYMFWQIIRSKSIAAGSSGVPITRTKLSARLAAVSLPSVIFFRKSGIRAALVFPAVIRLLAGILSGFIGVGGGFLTVPAMLYLLGVPPCTAVGTSLSQMVFTAGFGSIRHITSGNVLIFVCLLMLLGSSLGVQIGALATRYLTGSCMMFVLESTILISVIRSVFKLAGITATSPSGWMDVATQLVTFGGLALIVSMLLGLLVGRAYCRRCGCSNALTRYLYQDIEHSR